MTDSRSYVQRDYGPCAVCGEPMLYADDLLPDAEWPHVYDYDPYSECHERCCPTCNPTFTERVNP